MQFNIKKIEIQNFRSIQSKVTLEIKPGLFSIEGINMDEPSSKNGAGKSSIVSALYWCLTGNTLTNEVLADEVVNLKTGKDCRVTVYIDSDRGEIKVVRSRKDSELGNNLLLEIANQDLTCHKIAETQQRINQLLKIPVDLLHSTIMMTCDIKSAFSDLTPQQRIQTLESIRDYSLWDRVRDEANKDMKEIAKDIQESRLKLSSAEGSLKTYEQMYNRQLGALETLKINFDIKRIENEIVSLTDQKTTIDTQLVKLKEEIEKYNKVTKTDTSEYLQNLRKIEEEANVITSEKQKIEFENKQLDVDINTIDKWFKNDTCPTCKRPLERSNELIVEKTQEKENLLASKTKNIEIIAGLDVKLNEKRVEWSNLNKELTKLTQESKDVDKKIRKLNEENTQALHKLNLVMKTITEYENKKENHDKEVDTINNTLAEYKIEIEKINKQISAEQEVVTKLEYERSLADYFYKLLGAKGELRPYLLNRDIIFLNQCMQKYINRFFANTTVALTLNGANIDIVIETAGIKKSVSSLSGGEKKRLNLAIQLALYDLIKTTSRINFNVLWLDEVESQLDPLGCQQLIEIIEDKSDEIESVFWITNNAMVSENIPNKIVCKKIMGKTEIIEQ